MTLLIFSYNRALQLQTLLSSLLAYLQVDAPYSIHVLYAADNDDYQAGYEQVVRAYPQIQFHRERRQHKWAWPLVTRYWKNLYRYLTHSSLRRTTNFKSLTEQIIANSPHEGVLFLTDDSLFTRPVLIDRVRLNTVLGDSLHRYTLSLRHGLSLRPLPINIEADKTGGHVWRIEPNLVDLGHWTWRFSVDGHLYTRQALLPVLRRLNYANPNSLEGFVNEYISTVQPHLYSTLFFDAQPSLVGFILNKVQTYNGNRSFDIAPAYLNAKMLAGYQLRYHYQEPVTDFQPELEAVELYDPATGEQEVLKTA
ncbi:hypothetical protein [uncultured Fibrella sp.]|uniref:hypothetical protein n=1 Tax=uncultured Fibrella sp. TaxID=1284596 RepID=UPI0035CB435D